MSQSVVACLKIFSANTTNQSKLSWICASGLSLSWQMYRPFRGLGRRDKDSHGIAVRKYAKGSGHVGTGRATVCSSFLPSPSYLASFLPFLPLICLPLFPSLLSTGRYSRMPLGTASSKVFVRILPKDKEFIANHPCIL